MEGLWLLMLNSHLLPELFSCPALYFSWLDVTTCQTRACSICKQKRHQSGQYGGEPDLTHSDVNNVDM